MGRLSVADLSGAHMTLAEVNAHHVDVRSALVVFFSEISPEYQVRFHALSAGEIGELLQRRVEENDLSSSMTLLAAIEAAFKIDFSVRVEKKKKDSLSKKFRKLYNKKRDRVSLEEEIFDAWNSSRLVRDGIISDLKGLLKYRHWLAHGRYWKPKLARHQYDFSTVYQLAEEVFASFPFQTS